MNSHRYPEASQAIVDWLATIWMFHKSPDYLGYLSRTYGARIDILPVFECAYIGECDAGDIDSGRLVGIMDGWWVVDDSGTFAAKRARYDDSNSLFSRCPVLRFYTDGCRVLVRERLGPDLISQKVGVVRIENDSVTIVDVRQVPFV